MNLRNQKIFVTGGAGFIGSHLVEALAKTNRVTVYDNLTSSVFNVKNLKYVRFINGDILDQKKLTRTMKRHDVVVAMAAAHLRLSFKDPIKVHEINATGTLSTLLAAKQSTISRFIYISSSEAYGSATDKKMKEDHPIAPTTVYGVSKYIGELYTNEFGMQEGMKTTIIRPFNTYGPRSHFDGYYGEVIPRMVVRALNGLPPVIFGTGKQTRDFTYVSDTVAGIIAVLETKNTIGETVNVACGREIPIGQIARIISHLTHSSDPVFKSSRPNDVLRHAADITKVTKLSGWKPKVAIEEGIKQYIDWIKQTYPTASRRTLLLTKIPEKNW